MFKPRYGDCISCKRTGVIIPVKSGECQQCNYERKLRAKSNKRKNEQYEKRPIGNRKYILGSFRKKPTGETKDLSNDDKKCLHKKDYGITSRFKPKNATGEREVFSKIANSTEWRCFVCGKHLGELTASNFAHILPKALNKYPKFKLNADNIKLFCHDSYSSCHHRWDKEPRSNLKEQMWDKVFELEKELKNDYNKI